MGSTYLRLNYHVVFSTSHRIPSIDPAWQARLRKLGGEPLAIGGVADHIHLLLGLRATHRLADVMREVKKSSTVWVHREIGVDQFAWQTGYGAFTVSASDCDAVRRYIANQKEHHRVKRFGEEVHTMLARAGLVFDARYLE